MNNKVRGTQKKAAPTAQGLGSLSRESRNVGHGRFSADMFSAEYVSSAVQDSPPQQQRAGAVSEIETPSVSTLTAMSSELETPQWVVGGRLVHDAGCGMKTSRSRTL